MKRILSLLLAVILISGLAGCGGGEGSEESPEQAVKNALEAIKAADIEKASKYIDYDALLNADKEILNTEDKEQSERLTKMIFENIQYRILETSEEEDDATVSVEITNLDMGNVMTDFISQMFTLAFSGLSEEQLDEKSLEIFTDLISQESKTITKTVNINLSKSEDGWRVEGSDELADALSGGMVTYSDNMSSAFGGNEDTESDMLNEINNWLVGDIWNTGFCDISWYASSGTNSTGQTMDVDFALSQLDTAMNKKANYDTYIDQLTGNQYSQIKNVWAKLSPEIDALYSQIKNNKPVANDPSTDIDTGKFTQYEEAFSDAVYNLD